jgi:hypothetical protein
VPPDSQWSDANGWDQEFRHSTITALDESGDRQEEVCSLHSTSGGGAVLLEIACIDLFVGANSQPALHSSFGRFVDVDDFVLRDQRSSFATLSFADVNGDGRPETCFRTPRGITCLGGRALQPPIDGPPWSDAAGWNDPALFSTIQFVDLDRDGKSDVCGRARSGLECFRSTGTGFVPFITDSTFSDANGWADGSFASSIRIRDVWGNGFPAACGENAAGVTCRISSGMPGEPLATWRNGYGAKSLLSKTAEIRAGSVQRIKGLTSTKSAKRERHPHDAVSNGEHEL